VGGKPPGTIPVGDVNVHLNCVNYGATAKATATVPGGMKVRRKQRGDARSLDPESST
jgi:hypothetical protein